MNRIKAIIFDLDGTLVDSITDLGLCVHYALDKFGFESSADPKVYTHMVGNGTKKLVERAMEQYRVPIKEFDKIFDSFQNLYAAHALDNTTAYIGTAETVKALKNAGVSLAVHTNKPDQIAKRIVSHLFPNCFDCVLGQRDAFPLKPDPTVTESITERLGIPKTRCAFCGDSNVDIYTAKNAGIASIGVTWGFRSENELITAGADYIAHNACEIEKIVFSY